MINTVIDTINTFLTLPVKKYGIVEKIKRDERSYPAEYMGQGNYKEINFDFYSSLVYHRLGNQTSETDDSNPVACEENIKITQPVKLILYCKKDILSDDANGALKISNNIRNQITFSNDKDLCSLLQVDSVSVNIETVNFNSYEVWAGEFDNVDYKLESTHYLISFDYEIEIVGSKECILTYECE